MEQLRTRSSSLTVDLIDEVDQSWLAYLHGKLTKSLPNEEKLDAGSETAAFPRIVQRSQDAEWKAECIKRDEKFDMHLKALVSEKSRKFPHT